MPEIRTFQDYVISQQDFIKETVVQIVNTQGEFENKDITDLRKILAMYLSPDTHDRPDQLISLGIEPRFTMEAELGGSQTVAAFIVIDKLKRSWGDDSIRELARNLGEKLLVVRD